MANDLNPHLKKPKPAPYKIAIIIDDLGYNHTRDSLFITSSLDLSVSIIPFTRYATSLASLAEKHHKDTLIHVPMETLEKQPWEFSLTKKMSGVALNHHLKRMYKSIPNAIGINNHGGSLLTQNIDSMTHIMRFLAKNQLIFIDSRTTHHSVAERIAEKFSIPTQRRHIFLDNIPTVDAVRHQIAKLKRHAREHGAAIAIGHPKEATLVALTQDHEFQTQTKYQLVAISRLIIAHQSSLPSPLTTQ